MITLEKNSLVFRFPEVHDGAKCRVNFQRTLRIPDDGRTHYLPAGLGRFALRHMDDYVSAFPSEVARRGGVIMPMWQAEAMWINFDYGFWYATDGYPFAIKIATGKINAVTGEPWKRALRRKPQDYLVLPEQPWLDGYCVDKGVIRQFIAMPLGKGFTVEEQITGKAEHGGLQIIAYPMKRDFYERHIASQRVRREFEDLYDAASVRMSAKVPCMGLSPGGRMKQEIYDDPHGLKAWDKQQSSRCFVTILNATQWQAVTGELPPSTPLTAEDYTRRGIPWFDYYAADQNALDGAPTLKTVKSVQDLSTGTTDEIPSEKVDDLTAVVELGPDRRSISETRRVREARF